MRQENSKDVVSAVRSVDTLRHLPAMNCTSFQHSTRQTVTPHAAERDNTLVVASQMSFARAALELEDEAL